MSGRNWPKIVAYFEPTPQAWPGQNSLAMTHKFRPGQASIQGIIRSGQNLDSFCIFKLLVTRIFCPKNHTGPDCMSKNRTQNPSIFDPGRFHIDHLYPKPTTSPLFLFFLSLSIFVNLGLVLSFNLWFFFSWIFDYFILQGWIYSENQEKKETSEYYYSINSYVWVIPCYAFYI